MVGATWKWEPVLSPGQEIAIEDDRGMGSHRRSINISISTEGKGTFIRLTDNEALDLANTLDAIVSVG